MACKLTNFYDVHQPAGMVIICSGKSDLEFLSVTTLFDFSHVAYWCVAALPLDTLCQKFYSEGLHDLILDSDSVLSFDGPIRIDVDSTIPDSDPEVYTSLMSLYDHYFTPFCIPIYSDIGTLYDGSKRYLY